MPERPLRIIRQRRGSFAACQKQSFGGLLVRDCGFRFLQKVELELRPTPRSADRAWSLAHEAKQHYDPDNLFRSAIPLLGRIILFG